MKWLVATKDTEAGGYQMATKRLFDDQAKARQFADGLSPERAPVLLATVWSAESVVSGYAGALNCCVTLPDGSQRIVTVFEGGKCHPPLGTLTQPHEEDFFA